MLLFCTFLLLTNIDKCDFAKVTLRKYSGINLPQGLGVWMGLMTGSGCLSRVMGPVFVTYIYEEYGTIWTFSLTAVMMFLSLIWLLGFQGRLNPVEVIPKNEEEGQELNDVTHFESVTLNGDIDSRKGGSREIVM